jgi:hypothetical protein
MMLLWFWAIEEINRKWPNTLFNNSGDRRLSVVQFCDGAVVGLVAITPAAGYVSFIFAFYLPYVALPPSSGISPLYIG